MKKLIKSLIKKGIVCLVESSKEISKSYKQKSKNALKAAKVLATQDLVEESISMSYYSMYNLVLSLFFLVGIKSENHSASIFILKELFCLDNSSLLFAKKERINKQYYPNFNVSLKDAKDMIEMSGDFIVILEAFIDKVSLQDIKAYRSKFLRLVE